MLTLSYVKSQRLVEVYFNENWQAFKDYHGSHIAYPIRTILDWIAFVDYSKANP